MKLLNLSIVRIPLIILIIIVSFNPLYSQVNLSLGLVAKYDFSGNASDNSGNGHSGQLHNGIGLTSDRFGHPSSAYYFDGVDDYISVTDDGKFSTPQFSVAIWFQTESNDLQNLIGKRKFEDDGTQGGGAQYQLSINYAPFPGIVSNLVGNNSSCSLVANSSYINTVDQICNTNWYFVVVSFDGVTHKIYINGVLKRNVPSSFNSFLICNSELRFGNWWSGGTLPFKGKLDDIRWYNRPLNQDEVTALYGNFSNPSISTSEFTFSQNSCNPYQVNFINNSPNIQNASWNFGDGTTSNTINPVHTFNSNGNYSITLNTSRGNGCFDSILKTVYIGLNQTDYKINNDTTVCEGTPIILKAITAMDYCWTGPLVQNKDSTSIQVYPSNTSQYYCILKEVGNNLIINGDFSNGNSSFSSDYNYSNLNSAEGQYFIGNNPLNWNSGNSNCSDHTGNGGNMLMAKGSSAVGEKIWIDTLNVTKNTNFEFSAWVQSVNQTNTASLQLMINGKLIGTPFNASTPCNWIHYNISWNSGDTTKAVLSIIDNNLNTQGNIFAIDDIVFAPVFLSRDSVLITILPRPSLSKSNDTLVCTGKDVQLNASGATYYHWSPSAGLSDATISNPVANASIPTKYIVTAFNQPGCTVKDSVFINVAPLPVFSIDPKNKQLCVGQSFLIKASGADSYLWKTNNFNTVLGTDSGVEINFLNSDTLFAIVHNNICNITDTLSSTIQVNQLPVVTITKSNDVDCIIQTSKLKATGGSTYIWSPAVDISNINISNPEVFPITDTWYKVNVSDSHGCSLDDSILVHSFVQSKNGAFYVPTAFTPNNDGKNDCFSVKYWGKVDQFELWIYDRAGQIMFHTKNIQECWDGTYKGSLLGTGTYVYQIKASSVCSNGLVYKKGLLNLVR